MKDGVTAESNNYRADEFPNVTIKTEKDGENPYYHVTVTDKHAEPLVTVETFVRAVLPEGGGT